MRLIRNGLPGCALGLVCLGLVSLGLGANDGFDRYRKQVAALESSHDQAEAADERSEGCEASERNASEHAAVPQVNAVPQANQEEEDEDALWV